VTRTFHIQRGADVYAGLCGVVGYPRAAHDLPVGRADIVVHGNFWESVKNDARALDNSGIQVCLECDGLWRLGVGQ
jgi:hypothetical protein